MADGGLRLSGGGRPRGTGTAQTSRAVADAAKASEDAGFDYTGYGDTVWREAYVTLGAVASATHRVGIGPSVTNPVTRAPVAIAQAIATIDEMSDGRAWLGIGLGQSANAICGLPQATVAQLRDGLRTINSAFRAARAHEEWPAGIEVDESVVELQFVTRRVPILVAAGGPKTQQLAAEVADGVMLRAGDCDRAALPGVIERMRAWRDDGPRAGDPFEIQFMLPAYITDDVEEGRRMTGPVVSARANTSTRPSDLEGDGRQAIIAFKERYDYTHHASSVNPVNEKLMEEVGLADYFFDRYSFVGDEAAMLERLEELEQLGITALGIPGPVDAGLRVLDEYRRRHPAAATSRPSPLRPKPQG